jgi:predicted 3-demethylubiquinone-9 3-methyltransferase (glyoxalase superfamily)
MAGGNVMTTVTPFLMFQDGRAEEAMRLYASLFPQSRIEAVDHVGAGGQGKEGSLLRGMLNIAGQMLRFFDSPVKHGFEFTPSISLFVDCDTEAELDKLYAALLEGGGALMPLGNYGFSRKFGWVNDRFGVSWQLNLP